MTSGAPRRPGEWALVRARREWRASAVLVAATILGTPVAILALRLDRPLIVLLPLLGLVVLAARLADRRTDKAVRWTKGGRSEEAVGELLDSLCVEGYVVEHDIEQPWEGNVDHLVAGPTGVFLIETKHRRYKDGAPAKAKRQAAKLHAELGVWVTPVICVHARQRTPIRHQGVWVMSADQLLEWIRAQRGRQAEPAALARFVGRR